MTCPYCGATMQLHPRVRRLACVCGAQILPPTTSALPPRDRDARARAFAEGLTILVRLHGLVAKGPLSLLDPETGEYFGACGWEPGQGRYEVRT